mgnify:CR=1 FL=1
MTIISDNWADALDPIIHHWFEQGVGQRKNLVGPTLFNVQGSQRDYEEVSSVGAIGIDAWENYENSGQVPQVDFDQGYKRTYTHREFVVELEILQKFLEDNKFRQITDAALRLGDSAMLKRETDMAGVFNNAFTASVPYLGADAVALCSDSHPLSPQKAAAVQDNNFALALTKANVATIREAMMGFTDDTNNLVAVMPDLLLVPPELEDEALEISKSLLDPASGNNAINPQAGRFSVQPWHFLTDADAWFMIDRTMMKRGLDFFDRVPLNIKFEGVYKQVRASWTARMRYSYGWSDWRWVAGSNAS